MCELQCISGGAVLYFMPWQGLDTSIYLLQERSKAHFLFAFFWFCLYRWNRKLKEVDETGHSRWNRPQAPPLRGLSVKFNFFFYKIWMSVFLNPLGYFHEMWLSFPIHLLHPRVLNTQAGAPRLVFLVSLPFRVPLGDSQQEVLPRRCTCFIKKNHTQQSGFNSLKPYTGLFLPDK